MVSVRALDALETIPQRKCNGQCTQPANKSATSRILISSFRKIICDFGDHTGQLKRLPLYGRVAEDALGLPSTGPLTLCDRDCETLKRQKLWKRYKLRVQVCCPKSSAFHMDLNIYAWYQVAPKRSGRNGFKVIECRPFKFD